MRIRGLSKKFRLSRWVIVCLAVVVALASVGVTYARMKGPKPPKDDVVATSGCSDPFTWVATNDDGHLDYHDLYSPTDPIDPGDDGSVGDYDHWGEGDTSSSNDPSGGPPPGPEAVPGVGFPRYTKDVARTTAEIQADPQYMTVEIENAYPYYYPTVFFTLECPESRQGWIRDFVIEPVVDNSEPDPLNYITVTTSLLEINQPIPSGGEVMGALHILVNQNAEQGKIYKFRLSIYTECNIRTCGTAYAYGSEGVNDYAICFDEFGFSDWGWTNGPLTADFYEFPLYSGAGGCDITGLEPVGTLTIDYDGSTAIVTYAMYDGYTMDETHLYVGTEELPTNKKGNPTVSPGQYPYSNTLDNATTDTYTIEDLSGDIYVVAHAVACWFE